MKIKYLGTSAAEGIPNPFCACDTCKKARELGGREIRTRSQALINDSLLIDFPADTFSHAWKYNLDLSVIRNCIVTHVHEDHLYPSELYNLKKGFTHIPENYPPFSVYGSIDVINSLEEALKATNVIY